MQSLYIEDQKKLKIIGAKKIISSTSTQALVETEENSLIIIGNELEITKLDLENKEVEFLGLITSVKYTNTAERKGFFKRLFK